MPADLLRQAARRSQEKVGGSNPAQPAGHSMCHEEELIASGHDERTFVFRARFHLRVGWLPHGSRSLPPWRPRWLRVAHRL